MCNKYTSLGKTSFYIPLKHAMDYGTDILESIEKMNLICIDGIEEVISDELWERAIFDLINRAFLSKSRLIMTSSSDLQSLHFLLPDLESRIRKIQGHELYSIDDNEIHDALKYISNFASINLGEKEAKYLITYAKRDISNLVQILESLDKLSLEMKRKITIPLIRELI
jgi:DnaA family protein